MTMPIWVRGGIMFKFLKRTDRIVDVYLKWRNLVAVQRVHCNDRGFHKWHHADLGAAWLSDEQH